MRAIHIQHVLLSLDPGGLENGVVNIVNRLDAAEFRSSVCCLKRSGQFAERIIRPDVRVHELNLRKGEDYRLVFRLARLLRDTSTDIVHTRNQKAFFYGFFACKLAGVKVIVHSEHGREFPGKRHRMLLQRLCSRYTDAVVSMSRGLRQELVRYIGIPERKIQVIYNGVDFERFSPDMPADNIRRELGIAEDAVIVGATGRLVEVKNYLLLLRAARRIFADRRVVLLMIGDGPERATLEMYARRYFPNQSVIFAGFQAQVERYLGAMDIYVLPSLNEGISNTLLEAMAAGKAVIASRVGGNPEIVTHGKDGMLFDSGDEEQLAALLSKLYDSASQRTDLGVAARRTALGRFGLDRMIGEYESLYRQVYASNEEEAFHGG